ncbi:MAG TPA: hypothetical protein VGD41_19150, partial [Pyrinomonadaceae bacterium]
MDESFSAAKNFTSIKSIAGDPAPTDIFQPYRMGVELFSDMDEFFRFARERTFADAKELANEQRAISIVTPGRLVMVDPCPAPNSVPEEEVAPIRELMPPDPPKKIAVIGHTAIEALVKDIDKAIPFRGFLLGWAYLGHDVLVFEGHPSAFAAGVRDCDVLLVDSGRVAFLPLNWRDIAKRLMKPGGLVLVHDRSSYKLVQATLIDGRSVDSSYVEYLLRLLMASPRSSIEITSGSIVPDITELVADPIDREWLSQTLPFSFERDQINADSIIDQLLQKAGWSWYTPFKKNGSLPFPILMSDGSARNMSFTL